MVCSVGVTNFGEDDSCIAAGGTEVGFLDLYVGGIPFPLHQE